MKNRSKGEKKHFCEYCGKEIEECESSFDEHVCEKCRKECWEKSVAP